MPGGVTERLAANSSPGPNGCLVWHGKPVGKSGHCRLTIDGVRKMVHRWAWEQVNGPVPDGLFVLHHCDNPPCINPAHLWLGTRADNNHDRDRKGRHAGRRVTHCPQGHEYTPENTRVKLGSRHCRTCERITSLARYHRKKAAA